MNGQSDEYRKYKKGLWKVKPKKKVLYEKKIRLTDKYKKYTKGL